MNKTTASPAVAVPEGMDGLELSVAYGGLRHCW